jgi:disulfide bond formation protein DsbB
MPASAFALLGLFILLSIGVGIGAAWVFGPRRRAAVVVPILAAFLALYLLGHKSGLQLGPMVLIFGYSVAIVQDVLAAVAAAGAAALIQRAVLIRRATRPGASSRGA